MGLMLHKMSYRLQVMPHTFPIAVNTGAFKPSIGSNPHQLGSSSGSHLDQHRVMERVLSREKERRESPRTQQDSFY